MKNLYLIFCLLSISPCFLFAQGNCTTEVGILSTDTTFLCVQSSIEVNTEGAVLEEKDALVYFVHTMPDIFEGTIVDTSLTGNVEWNTHENEAIEFHQLYYLSAVVGLDEDTDGLPDDLTAECTVVSEAMPMVWVAEFEVLADVDCSLENVTFIDSLCDYRGIDITTSFFIPQIIEQNIERKYTISANSSNLNFETLGGKHFTFSFNYNQSTGYHIDFHITDNWQCLDTTIYIDTGCPSNWSDLQTITDIPSELQVICSEGNTQIQAGCIYGSNIGGESYVLCLTPEYYANQVIATKDGVGSFSYLDAKEYWNQELYVFGKAKGFLPGGLTHDIISPTATPIVFLQPFEVAITVDDCEANMAQLQLSVIGGFPSYDGENTDIYQIVSDLYEGDLKLGEVINIEVTEPTTQLGEMLFFEVTDSYGCAQSIEVPNPCLTDVGIYTFEKPSFSLENTYPIPAKDFLQIHIQALQKERIQLQLVDIRGKVIMEQFRELQSGDNQLQVEVNELSPGIYFLQLESREGRIVQKVVFD